MQQRLADIHAHGASLVAISPQLPDQSLTMAEKNELAFPVLSDEGNSVARKYGLVFTLSEGARELFQGFGIDLPQYNGAETFELPVPATFVVDATGIIRAAQVSADYKLRMEPEEIVQVLATLT